MMEAQKPYRESILDGERKRKKLKLKQKKQFKESGQCAHYQEKRYKNLYHLAMFFMFRYVVVN